MAAPKRRFRVVHENELRAEEEASPKLYRTEHFVRLGTKRSEEPAPEENRPSPYMSLTQQTKPITMRLFCLITVLLMSIVGIAMSQPTSPRLTEPGAKQKFIGLSHIEVDLGQRNTLLVASTGMRRCRPGKTLTPCYVYLWLITGK